MNVQNPPADTIRASLQRRCRPPASVENARRPEPTGFLSAYPGYRSTALLDRLRASEYSYLDAGGHAYLDYAGAGLPAQAQLRAHAERIGSRCFGASCRYPICRPGCPGATASGSTASISG